MKSLHQAAFQQHAETAMMLEEIGDYDCALEQYRECIRHQAQEAANEDDDEAEIMIAETHMRIGCLLAYHLKDYDGACIEIQKCYTTRKLLLGKDHADTQECLECMETIMEMAIQQREKSYYYKKKLNTNHRHSKSEDWQQHEQQRGRSVSSSSYRYYGRNRQEHR